MEDSGDKGHSGHRETELTGLTGPRVFRHALAEISPKMGKPVRSVIDKSF